MVRKGTFMVCKGTFMVCKGTFMVRMCSAVATTPRTCSIQAHDYPVRLYLINPAD